MQPLNVNTYNIYTMCNKYVLLNLNHSFSVEIIFKDYTAYSSSSRALNFKDWIQAFSSISQAQYEPCTRYCTALKGVIIYAVIDDDKMAGWI